MVSPALPAHTAGQRYIVISRRQKVCSSGARPPRLDWPNERSPSFCPVHGLSAQAHHPDGNGGAHRCGHGIIHLTARRHRRLRDYHKFYLYFPDGEIWHACVPNLTWTHFRSLLRVPDTEARAWYLNEASRESWSSRTLDRNIGSQYYHRLLASQSKDAVKTEMKTLTSPMQTDKLEFIKNPVVAEFLGLTNNSDFTESQLKQSILTRLQKFLMELGKGYAFVARQQHIATDA